MKNPELSPPPGRYAEQFPCHHCNKGHFVLDQDEPTKEQDRAARAAIKKMGLKLKIGKG
jgi:hypothetical protein